MVLEKQGFWIRGMRLKSTALGPERGNGGATSIAFRRDRRPCRSISWILEWLRITSIELKKDTAK